MVESGWQMNIVSMGRHNPKTGLHYKTRSWQQGLQSIKTKDEPTGIVEFFKKKCDELGNCSKVWEDNQEASYKGGTSLQTR